MKLKPKINADRFLAFSAIFISVSALVVSVLELRMADKQQRLSMLPLITIGGSYGSKGVIIRLQNGGVGPGIVTCARLKMKNQVYIHWDDLLGQFKAPGYDVNKSSVKGIIIPAGESRELLSITPSPLADSLAAHIKEMRIDVCYSSLYEETWCLADDFLPSSRNTAVSVTDCTIPENEQFEY